MFADTDATSGADATHDDDNDDDDDDDVWQEQVRAGPG